MPPGAVARNAGTDRAAEAREWGELIRANDITADGRHGHP